MFNIESLYSFIEGNFCYLLVTDEDGKIVYANKAIINDLNVVAEHPIGRNLEEILTSSSVKTTKSAVEQARINNRSNTTFTSRKNNKVSIPLKVGYIESSNTGFFVFFGDKAGCLGAEQEWEKNERIKELSCIYNIAELIEVSKTIEEFFLMLPNYLSAGMMNPEEAVVYSSYDGKEYGQQPNLKNYIVTDLIVKNKKRGEIRVGYLDNSLKLLPEEQKMLDEIGRMLSMAFERKELKEKLEKLEKEGSAFKNRLEELKGEIAARTIELEDQKRKLSIVNSYLERVNRGWDKARSNLETIFKAIPDKVVLLDKNRKVVMTNQDEIKPGTYCYASVFGRDKPCDDCRLDKILSKKTPLTITIKHEDRYFQVHALPIFNRQHEVDGILEFYRDITLEKTYEQQLQQADKLASIGELVSGIGHEINNPNQFIRGNIKIIKQAFGDILPILDEYYKFHPDLKIAKLNYPFFLEHIMTLINDIEHGSERIKNIVQGLRNFAKKNEGLLVDTVRINTIVEDAIKLVQKEVRKKAEIILDLSPDLPTFKGNAQKIEQVLVNLIVNAGQAIPDDRKGQITVRTKKNNSDIIVQVEDNGCGMSEKTLNQIFNPFFTTKRGKGGTGLGLPIVFRIVEEHGGKIYVKSKLGEGSIFTITIPVKSPQANKGE